MSGKCPGRLAKGEAEEESRVHKPVQAEDEHDAAEGRLLMSQFLGTLGRLQL